jgi:hypothetical protein
MSTKAQAVLEEFQRLPLPEQREVSEFILRQLARVPQPASPRRTIAEIAGKYHTRPDPKAKDHDRGFAEAAAA